MIKKCTAQTKFQNLKTVDFLFATRSQRRKKSKTIRSKQTGDLIQRRKEIQKLQTAAPFCSIVSLKPFGMILNRYIDDRKNDAANGHLREATLDGYNYHIDRLRLFRLEHIIKKAGCINLVR